MSRGHRENSPSAAEGFQAVTRLGQSPVFIDDLNRAEPCVAWLADGSLASISPDAPGTRDLLGTLMLRCWSAPSGPCTSPPPKTCIRTAITAYRPRRFSPSVFQIQLKS